MFNLYSDKVMCIINNSNIFYDLISDLFINISSDYHSDLNHGTGECSSRTSGEKSFGNPHGLSCRVVFTLQNPKNKACSVLSEIL